MTREERVSLLVGVLSPVGHKGSYREDRDRGREGGREEGRKRERESEQQQQQQQLQQQNHHHYHHTESKLKKMTAAQQKKKRRGKGTKALSRLPISNVKTTNSSYGKH